MKRFWVSLLTVLIYALAQFLPGMLLRSGLIHPEKGMETTQFMIYTQVSLFIIAAILIILINLYIKNPTRLEAGHKESKRYIISWALLGFCIVMVYQVIVSLIYTLVLGQQQQSPNTERLMAIAKQMPVFIILISVVGPILEEYVFRKVLFGELYNAIKGNRILAFLIASIVSSLLFALAHNDIKFLPMYFGMGMLFSLAYAYTNRIAIPIGIHMLQNGTVVIMQVFGGETLKKVQEQANFIIQIIFN
ncbi:MULTISPECIES: intramembrane glutamic endopeptidase MroQ [Staphylococcus]|uniref:intramembrane glutamic endopeptidase MroQ n=1 Tax=Staphylococcus TaxID=1279 RepID=UPI0002463C31|nr:MULTISPECIES: type II CAAX endopeptidase family protein [Staphylococcus]QAV32209.1 CPBP family intramembrane metalloprotease [Sulfitobacter donghicola]AGZ24786.1 abortive infection family protein [Staphylococcus pasteuri SP1]MBN6853796.1 CPBP family intramembrane metalloprotease [Staphylococcus warneri]MBT2770331.1 CPBP family intramembrane metalloprotease [Staphylococcus warneri]MBX7841242.1 CPBP family intramembrane metalloprotease [Staphylococcus warneri]